MAPVERRPAAMQCRGDLERCGVTPDPIAAGRRSHRVDLDHGSGHGTSQGGQAQRSPPAAARDSVDCASACPPSPYGRKDDEGHKLHRFSDYDNDNDNDDVRV